MISALTLFCEDIRQEIGGSATIVGVLPDNLAVPSLPGAVPKFGIYTRIVMPNDTKPQAMRVLLRAPTGEETVLGDFARDFVKATCADARERGNPVAGFISTAVSSPFPVLAPGRFLAILRIGNKDQITGGINFDVDEEAASSRSTSP